MSEHLVYKHPSAQGTGEVNGPSKSSEEIYGERQKSVTKSFEFHDNIELRIPNDIRRLVESYNGGPLDASLTKSNKILFGELLDVELPIETVLLLDNDTYWRRVVETNTKYKFTHLNESRTVGFSYKKLALRMKFIELIETTSPEEWNLNHFVDLARKLSPFITKLSITQLQSRSQLLLDKNIGLNAEYRIYNYPIDECDHGDLSFLPELRHLQELSIEFGVKNLSFKYQKRHFDFSYKDVDILSNAVSKMPSLRTFAIRRSFLSNRKIDSFMRALSSHCSCCCLVKLELSFCQLTSTKSIAQFLTVNNTLKALELKGNYLSGNEVADLATAISQYNGHLYYLGLAYNPLQSIGLKCILRNLLNSTQVNDLDISGCHFDANDVPFILNFVKSHEILHSINLTAIPLNDDNINGENLVKIVQEHCRILKLLHKSCGLSEEQEMNLRILLERNNYYEANPIVRCNGEMTPEQEAEIDLMMKQKIHRLLAEKVMPEFFRKNAAKSDDDIIAAESDYVDVENSRAEREFVDRVGFY